jgi:preprotein translocase subunit YajC
MNLFFALTDAGTQPAGGGIITILMLVGMFAVFYFVGIRPQKKQEKAQNAMRNALSVGDEITTIGGIIGKIISIKEETCVIETSHDRTQIRILKTAISRVDVKAEDAD